MTEQCEWFGCQRAATVRFLYNDRQRFTCLEHGCKTIVQDERWLTVREWPDAGIDLLSR